jgi:hypothetical protein
MCVDTLQNVYKTIKIYRRYVVVGVHVASDPFLTVIYRDIYTGQVPRLKENRLQSLSLGSILSMLSRYIAHFRHVLLKFIKSNSVEYV